MAGRALNFRHQAEIREKIRASHIIKRLDDHIEGKVELLPTQVNAAKILLNKCLPDLQSIQGPGDDGSHKFELVAPWLQQQISRRNG